MGLNIALKGEIAADRLQAVSARRARLKHVADTNHGGSLLVTHRASIDGDKVTWDPIDIGGV